MRKDTKSELRMLREVAWFFLARTPCHFCQRMLIDPAEARNRGFGTSNLPRIPTRVTPHHIDHDRENNRFSNIGYSHKKCHKAYHLKQRRKK